MLSRVVERYNFIRHQSEPCEFNIIEGQLIRIDNDLNEALDNATWLDYRKLAILLRKLIYLTLAPVYQEAVTSNTSTTTSTTYIGGSARLSLTSKKF